MTTWKQGLPSLTGLRAAVGESIKRGSIAGLAVAPAKNKIDAGGQEPSASAGEAASGTGGATPDQATLLKSGTPANPPAGQSLSVQPGDPRVSNASSAGDTAESISPPSLAQRLRRVTLERNQLDHQLAEQKVRADAALQARAELDALVTEVAGTLEGRMKGLAAQLEAQQGESAHLSAEREAITASFADMRGLLQRSAAVRKALQDRLRQLQTAPAGADTAQPIQVKQLTAASGDGVEPLEPVNVTELQEQLVATRHALAASVLDASSVRETLSTTEGWAKAAAADATAQREAREKVEAALAQAKGEVERRALSFQGAVKAAVTRAQEPLERQLKEQQAKLAQCQAELTAAQQQASASQRKADTSSHQGERAAAELESVRMRAEASEAAEEEARAREEAARAAAQEATAKCQTMLEALGAAEEEVATEKSRAEEAEQQAAQLSAHIAGLENQAEGSQRSSAVETARWRAAADAAAELVRKADARAEAAQASAREGELASAQVCSALRARNAELQQALAQAAPAAGPGAAGKAGLPPKGPVLASLGLDKWRDQRLEGAQSDTGSVTKDRSQRSSSARSTTTPTRRSRTSNQGQRESRDLEAGEAQPLLGSQMIRRVMSQTQRLGQATVRRARTGDMALRWWLILVYLGVLHVALMMQYTRGPAIMSLDAGGTSEELGRIVDDLSADPSLPRPVEPEVFDTYADDETEVRGRLFSNVLDRVNILAQAAYCADRVKGGGQRSSICDGITLLKLPTQTYEQVGRPGQTSSIEIKGEKHFPLRSIEGDLVKALQSVDTRDKFLKGFQEVFGSAVHDEVWLAALTTYDVTLFFQRIDAASKDMWVSPPVFWDGRNERAPNAAWLHFLKTGKRLHPRRAELDRALVPQTGGAYPYRSPGLFRNSPLIADINSSAHIMPEWREATMEAVQSVHRWGILHEDLRPVHFRQPAAQRPDDAPRLLLIDFDRAIRGASEAECEQELDAFIGKFFLE
ncbi:hypothetical protein WJX73_002598 [Symbiochloris irregularis]|uniref:Protein kinase domain-containing protein n=1 Tax=Symbiochloris irregularis TaxID=706552 RepID=A0AAW1PRF0_9CHLO